MGFGIELLLPFFYGGNLCQDIAISLVWHLTEQTSCAMLWQNGTTSYGYIYHSVKRKARLYPPSILA